MKTINTASLFAYSLVTGLLFVNGSCGKTNDPAPAVTTTVVPPTIPEGLVVQNVQTETGLWAETKADKFDLQFNNDGQLIAVTKSHQSNYSVSSTMKCTLTYGTDGFLASRTIVVDYATASSIPQSITKETFTYQNNRLSKVVLSKNIDENYKEVTPFAITKNYQYDAKGNLTQYQRIDQNGQEVERDDYAYDATGQLISAKEYNKKETSTVDYTIANGRLARRVVMYQGKVNFINDYTYDSEGQNTRYTTTNSVGQSSYWTLVYDDKKAPIDLTTFLLVDTGIGLGGDYLLFKGHPAAPLSYGSRKHNLLSITDSNPLGRQLKYTHQYNSQGYPTETTYSVYNGTQKATTDGKNVYTYFK